MKICLDGEWLDWKPGTPPPLGLMERGPWQHTAELTPVRLRAMEYGPALYTACGLYPPKTLATHSFKMEVYEQGLQLVVCFSYEPRHMRFFDAR